MKVRSERRVLVVTTGGTIASRVDPADGSLVSVVAGQELVADFRARRSGSEIVIDEFCNVGSNLIDLETSFELARHIDARLTDETIGGCVVLHGTDTLEESAFLADLVIRSPKPVVFTGAQRSADAPDADGPRNLADAVRVASSPEARDLGTTVVFDGDILAASDAVKMHASRVAAFGSSSFGPLGAVDGEDVFIGRKPVERPSFRARRIERRVDLITMVMGLDDRLLNAAFASGADGIVLEAFGRGNVTPPVLEAVSRGADRGIPTVVTSRCMWGRALPVYAGAGGRDLEKAGAIFAGRLSGPKARILLSVMPAEMGVRELKALFEHYGR